MLTHRKIFNVWRAYLFGASLSLIGERYGLSRKQIQWAIDEANRRERRKREGRAAS